MKHKIYKFDPDRQDVSLCMLNSFVHDSRSIVPGVVKLSRVDYGRFMQIFSKPKWLPLSGVKYEIHIPTEFGLIPVLPSDNLKSGDVIIEPRVDVHEVFEKVYFDDEDTVHR